MNSPNQLVEAGASGSVHYRRGILVHARQLQWAWPLKGRFDGVHLVACESAGLELMYAVLGAGDRQLTIV